MNLALRLLASWFVVSIPFGILLGRGLKVLATRPSGTTVLSHEAKPGVPAHRRVLLQIATSAAATAGVGSEQGQSIFPTSKQALSRPRVVEMSGTSDAQLRVGSLRNKTTYDLRGFVSTAYREEVTSYPLSFGIQEATSGLVVIGGQVLGGNPWEWTWQQWEACRRGGGNALGQMPLPPPGGGLRYRSFGLSSVGRARPILGLQRMKSFTDQQRFVLAVGDAVESVVEDSAVVVLDRLDRVVLIETSYGSAVQIRHTPGVIIHIFEREAEARRAFGLFQH